MPRKLGQHFLIDQNILEKMAAAACGEYTPRVIEIGPGRGALTRVLLTRTGELHAIEIDQQMIAQLVVQWPSERKLHVHHADVLRADLSAWGPAVITGNLPYYITSPIVEKFLALDERFEKAVFLMQFEVAARIMAKAGTRDYGYLSLCCQLVCDLELVCKVPAGAFRPPPKVESAAITFKRHHQVPSNLASVLQLASRAFAQKRKTLRNNLRSFYGGRIESQPEASLRAEQLTPGQFVDLHERLAS